MTAVTGHVFGIDFPPKYNSWDKVDPVSHPHPHHAPVPSLISLFSSLLQADLFECETVKNECNEKGRVPGMLRAEGRGASWVVLWLDCDKEGENICFEVISILSETLSLVPGKVRPRPASPSTPLIHHSPFILLLLTDVVPSEVLCPHDAGPRDCHPEPRPPQRERVQVC
jgi:hypothetical protein